ncbi:MAG: zf-HC2 domain-containing protein [Blastocatellia bacterium]
MDRLLRGHASQHLGPKQPCKQFDPDLANAYIEQSLTSAEREGFEQHLSLCAHCRTATVSLERLASAEAPALLFRPGRQVAAEGWRERLGALAGAMTTPRWAMAAAAVIVLAVSMPVLLSRTDPKNSAQSAANEETANVQSVSQPEITPLSQAEPATRTSVVVSEGRSAGSDQKPAVVDEVAPQLRGQAEQLLAKNQSPAEQSPQPPSNRLDEQKREAAGGVAPGGVAGGTESIGQAERQIGQQQAPPPPQQQSTDADQLAKVDAEGARRLPEAAKDSAQVSVLKSGRADGEERAGAGAKIRPEDNNAPASPIAVPDSAARRALAQPSASSMRDGRLNASARSRGTAERKIGKKRFWLRDDVWTDNDYNPEKEMPMVTIVRDSDVFKEVIGKRAALKGYLTGFAETERAIVVYKGTIYKLIPQQDNK